MGNAESGESADGDGAGGAGGGAAAARGARDGGAARRELLEQVLASPRGYRVLALHEGSPTSQGGIVPFLDVIVAADGCVLSSDFAAFSRTIKEFEARPLTLTLFNTKMGCLRDTTFVPHTGWGGEGLLGMTIKLDAFDHWEEGVAHVLQVEPGSPGQQAALEPFSDYVVGALVGNGQASQFADADEMAELVREAAELRRGLTLFVYNSATDVVRRAVVHPREGWGGEGLLGCGIGFGYLHRLPHAARRTPGIARAQDMIPAAPRLGRPAGAAPAEVAPAPATASAEAQSAAARAAHAPAAAEQAAQAQRAAQLAAQAQRAAEQAAHAQRAAVQAAHAPVAKTAPAAAPVPALAPAPAPAPAAASAAPQPHDDEHEQHEPASSALPRLVRTKDGDLGKLCGTRANGTSAIELAWGLPNGCMAIAFLRPSSFEQLPLEARASRPTPAGPAPLLGLLRPDRAPREARSHSSTDDEAKLEVIDVELETQDVDELR
jgi:hypothetical protein